ncbi:MAG TPA: permease-like cell division protein FtsX [Vitreimonas sp.]|nr:permease-like cell division protein FtsX [Vitreimonas sp.]
MIGFIVFSLRRAWQGFWRNAVMSLAATATMVLMLLLLAGFWIINTGLLAGLQYTESKVNIVADLYDNVTPRQIDELVERVEAMPEVTEVVYVSRADALERFRDNRQAQNEEDLTRFLDSNPFHASLEISLAEAAQYTTVQRRLCSAAGPTGTGCREEPAIEGVKNQQALVDNVLTVTNFLQTAGVVVLVTIGLIVLFIIVNTIRLAVVARAEEIEIMRLVGASDAFIRWPFVFEGALVGLLGAVLALGILAAATEPLGTFMFDFFRVLPLEFGGLARDITVLVLAAGVGLGIVGSWLSVRTYLIR